MYRKYYSYLSTQSKTRDNSPEKSQEGRSLSLSQPLHDFTNIPLKNLHSNQKTHQQISTITGGSLSIQGSSQQHSQRQLPKRVKTVNNTPERTSLTAASSAIRSISMNRSNNSSSRYDGQEKPNKQGSLSTSVNGMDLSMLKNSIGSDLRINNGTNGMSNSAGVAYTSSIPQSAGLNNRRRTSNNGLSQKTPASGGASTASKLGDTLRGIKSASSSSSTQQSSQQQPRQSSNPNIWSVLGYKEKYGGVVGGSTSTSSTSPYLQSVNTSMINLKPDLYNGGTALPNGSGGEDEIVRRSINTSERDRYTQLNQKKSTVNNIKQQQQQSYDETTAEQQSQKPDSALSKYLQVLSATEKNKKTEERSQSSSHSNSQQQQSFESSHVKKGAVSSKRRSGQSSLFNDARLKVEGVDGNSYESQQLKEAHSFRQINKPKIGQNGQDEPHYSISQSYNHPPPRSLSSNGQNNPSGMNNSYSESLRPSTSANLQKRHQDVLSNLMVNYGNGQTNQSSYSAITGPSVKKRIADNSNRSNSTSNTSSTNTTNSNSNSNYLNRLSNMVNRGSHGRSNSTQNPMASASFNSGSNSGNNNSLNLQKQRNTNNNNNNNNSINGLDSSAIYSQTHNNNEQNSNKTEIEPPFSRVNANLAANNNGMEIVSSNRTRKGAMASNPKKVNQDSMFMSDRMRDDEYEQIYFLGVMDGHGSNGHFVSQFIRNHIQHEFLLLQNSEKDYAKRLSKMTDNLNTKLASSQIDCSFSGTTMVSLLLLFSKNTLRILSCNCGDSRAIMGLLKSVTQTVQQQQQQQQQLQSNNAAQKAHPVQQNTYLFEVLELSRDHKPELPDERARIIAQNGRIDSYRDEFGNQLGPMRVWLQSENIPGIAMSRSLGDNLATSVGVTWQAEIKEFYVNFTPPAQQAPSQNPSRASTPNRQQQQQQQQQQQKNSNIDWIEAERGFIIIGSDGVWEFLPNEDIVREVGRFYVLNDIEGACDWLLQEAYQKWTVEDDSVVDDITFIIIFLSHQSSGLAQQQRTLSLSKNNNKNQQY